VPRRGELGGGSRPHPRGTERKEAGHGEYYGRRAARGVPAHTPVGREECTKSAPNPASRESALGGTLHVKASLNANLKLVIWQVLAALAGVRQRKRRTGRPQPRSKHIWPCLSRSCGRHARRPAWSRQVEPSPSRSRGARCLCAPLIMKQQLPRRCALDRARTRAHNLVCSCMWSFLRAAHGGRSQERAGRQTCRQLRRHGRRSPLFARPCAAPIPTRSVAQVTSPCSLGALHAHRCKLMYMRCRARDDT